MNENKILVPLDDYEEKAKDQRTLEIMREILIRNGMIYTDALCAMLGIVGEPWKEKKDE